jgi:TatD DNase family protein
MEFFDSHAHYNDEKFEADREAILSKLYNEENITRITCVGYNLEKSKFAIKLAKENSFLFSTVGISPNDIEDFSEENLKEIEELAKTEKVVAIGEIGLDYYWNKENKEKQQELFIKQIDIANKLDLPIVIHTRDASVDTIQILKEHPVKNTGIFHCCPLNQELIKNGLSLGFYISFSGNITFKNAKSEGAVSLVPMDKLLIETDSPYLTPEPYRGTRNDSSKVKLVAKKVAEIKNIPLEEVAKITYENAKRIFKIEK